MLNRIRCWLGRHEFVFHSWTELEFNYKCRHCEKIVSKPSKIPQVHPIWFTLYLTKRECRQADERAWRIVKQSINNRRKKR